MSISDTFKKLNLSLINDIKEQNIRWEEKKSEIYDIEKTIETYQLKTDQELKKEEVKFKYEIEQLEKRVAAEAQDFRDFLDAIDNLKNELNKHFSLPIGLMIHQYAKRLLVSMWNSQDVNERTKYQQQLFNLLYTLNSDIDLVESEQENTKNINLPENTLKLIRQNEDLKTKVDTKSHNYIQIARSIVGGASLGAIIGTPFFGFVGSVVGAVIGGAVTPFLVLKEESQGSSQDTQEKSNES